MSLRSGMLAIVLMLFSLSSHATSLVAKDSAGNSVTLQDTACVAAPWLKDWKNATMLYKGKVYEACWRIQGGTVVILDSGGDVTPVPMTAFTRETSI